MDDLKERVEELERKVDMLIFALTQLQFSVEDTYGNEYTLFEINPYFQDKYGDRYTLREMNNAVVKQGDIEDY